jgi:hypothetical protein
MSYKLFLDDERNPKHVTWIEIPLGPWVVVRSYDHFVKYITQHGLPDFITFDHDLGVEHYAQGAAGTAPTYDNYKERTGFHCAQWLIEYCMDNKLDIPEYTVHSMNPIGRDNINSVLTSFKNQNI